MPTIVQTVNGKVTGLWGSALRRTPTGQLVALKMGDVIHTGDVILTTQDGIVELKPEADAPQTVAKAPETDDIDRVIAELNQPDSDTAPAAGLTGGDGSGLQPGLRVDRIAEGITAGAPAVARETEPAPAPTPFTTATNGDQATAGAATPANAQPTASAAAVSVNEDTTLPVSLGGHDADGSIVAVTVVSVPAGSSLLLADGVTPVVAGQSLTPVEAAGLLFRPAPDFNGGVAVTFTVTDNQGGVSAPATVQIDVLPVNDSPIAHTGIASLGPEFSAIPVNLSGSDIDGTVTGVTITTAPAGGSLFLADGVTPVVPGTVLTAAQAASLVFVGDAGFTGPTTIGFTVTDDQGATSAPASAQVSVTPVPTTLTLDSSAAAVAEGGSVVYTASVDHAVSGSPLVVTLTNGATITIPVGQTSGSSAPVVPRADDAYAQGDETQTIAVAGTSGASYSSLVTSDTVVTTVSDDLDTTTVSLGASAATVAEGGSIVYTASVNNPVTGSPLVITLSNGQTVTIPVGQSSASSAPFAVRPDDAYAQGDQGLTVSITGTQGGQYESLANGPAVTTTVTDNADTSTVSLTASAASVTEGGSIVYTASVSHPVTDSPLVLTLSNGQTITIPVGQSSASSAPFAVRPDDALVQGDQTLSVGIATTSGGHYEALSPAGNAVTIVSDDADPTTVTVTASAGSVTEGGSIVYTASLSNAVTGVPLVITLSNGQVITIPVGQSSGSSAPFAVRADDADLQGTETLSVDVASTSGGNFEALTSTGPATTTVGDDADATTVTLTASATAVNEGGSIVYTASVDHPVSGTALEITLTNGQHITIPVGQSSADSAPFAVRADDLYAQGDQALPVGIAGTSGGSYESLVTTSTVSTLVQDDHDASTVSLSATPAVAEGGGIVYTATLTAPAQTDVTVTLSNNATLTIAAGSSSGSVLVAAPADDVYTSAGTVSATITAATGGGFESLSIDPAAATTAVSDTLDTTTVSLTGASTVAEGAAAGYTVSLTSPAHGDVTVTLSYSGTAADGSDFTGVTTVTIPDGASSANFSIAT
ncbi:MAG: hypothetical protein KF891_23935, partial [Rhizobacter sp.]|nr:hypothetical protein [Rhizobacter sp.]